jgi:hypothetical protein
MLLASAKLPATRAVMAGGVPRHEVLELWCRRGGRFPVLRMLGTAMSRGRAGQTSEALTVLGLIIRRSPADVRARFRDQLRSVNLADPAIRPLRRLRPAAGVGQICMRSASP